MKCYAGIGSRKTPQNILYLMSKIGYQMGTIGYTLRSGGANGADTAFERVHKQYLFPMEIYLPSKYFNGRVANNIDYIDLSTISNSVSRESVDQYHPNSSRLTPFVRKLMERSWFQIIGKPNTPISSYVFCYYIPLSLSGTNQAIRIAEEYEVRIFNLWEPKIYDFWFNRTKNITLRGF